MRRLILSGILICSAGTVQAGPDATSTYLMNESVSVLDFGIFKMEETLSKYFATNSPSVTVSASYLWDNNQIQITLLELAKRKTRNDAIEFCKTIVGSARASLGINTSTGKPIVEGLDPSRFFVHEGYDNKRAPKSLVNDISRMIRIKGVVGLQDPVSASCEASLLGKEILMSQ